MKLSRRKFLVNSSLSLAGTMFFSNNIFANKNAMETILGIQLYSVRDDMKKDPTGYVETISCNGIQKCGTCQLC